MAIAYVTSTNNGVTGSSPASVTFAHNNTSTGTNHCLIVGVAGYGGGSLGDRIASVTYNGVSMSRALIADTSGADTAGYIYIYYLLNPASGSNNVVVTQTGSKATNLACVAVLYSGVDNVAPINATGENNSNLGVLTASATLTSDSWLVGMGHIASQTISMSPPNGTTARVPSGDTEYKFCDSNAALATGSRSLSLNRSSDAQWAMGVVALKVLIQTSTITEGVKVGDSGTSSFRIAISNLVDGIKVGDVAQTYKALVSLLTDGIKVGDLASTVINPITAWVNKVKNSTIWTNKGKRE